MKSIWLFVREHGSLLLFQMALVLFIFLLYWLDGFRNYNTAIYSLIISTLLTSGYLAGKYVLRRSFYTQITRVPESMENALIRYAPTPEHAEISRFMRVLYKLYQNEVQTLYTAQNRQRDFMNHWVHQMKTPISVIGLLLQEKGELDRDSVSEEIERLQSGLDTVLLNARLETFEEDMHIEKVNLKKLIQEVVTDHKRLFIANGVFPVISIDEHFVIATDLKWMRVVIAQFLTNAVKYTFDEGKKVNLFATQTEQGIALSIQDEGVGIPASDLNRITRAFFTGENGRLTGESTGMGLYIASVVCERLGHPLQIESKQTIGTTVTVLFENGESEGNNDGEESRGTERSNENL
ncbi:sensor histidine kinase [Sporosarcina sp. CAU 1771]